MRNLQSQIFQIKVKVEIIHDTDSHRYLGELKFKFMLHIPSLYIAESPIRGRGVFTAERIENKSLIEICPLLTIPPKQVAAIHKTVFHDYYFLLPDSDGAACIPLGYGCLYNHSKTPNAEARIADEQLEIHAIKNILAGGEIFIDYQGGDKAFEGVWFDVV